MGSTLGPTLANTFLRVSKCRGWGGERGGEESLAISQKMTKSPIGSQSPH